MPNFLLKKVGLAFDQSKTGLALKKASLALMMTIESKTSSAKTKRKKAAAALEGGMRHQASLDIEQLIRQELEVEAYDTVRRQCNLLADHLKAVATEKVCPAKIKQTVVTLIWAADKGEVPAELSVVKAQLSRKYGKEFVLRALRNEDDGVDEAVSRNLLFQVDPLPYLVEEHLEIIAKETEAAGVKKASEETKDPTKTTCSAPEDSPKKNVELNRVETPEENASGGGDDEALKKPLKVSPEEETADKALMETPAVGPEDETPKESPEDETPKVVTIVLPSNPADKTEDLLSKKHVLDASSRPRASQSKPAKAKAVEGLLVGGKVGSLSELKPVAQKSYEKAAGLNVVYL